MCCVWLKFHFALFNVAFAKHHRHHQYPTLTTNMHACMPPASGSSFIWMYWDQFHKINDEKRTRFAHTSFPIIIMSNVHTIHRYARRTKIFKIENGICACDTTPITTDQKSATTTTTKYTHAMAIMQKKRIGMP